MESPMVETVTHGLEPIALIIRSKYEEPGIRFFTPWTFSQQIALMSHPKGHRVDPHVHNLIVRQVFYTQEVLIVRRGRVRVNLYTSSRELLGGWILEGGDLILLCGGGHSLEMIEDSAMIEIKQGPYAGEQDKTRFKEKK